MAGRPMVEWSIAAFRAAAGVESLVVACPAGHSHELEEAGAAGQPLEVVEGGATRAHSVANALAGVDTELVAIHDAARPLVTAELIEQVAAALAADAGAAGAIAATRVTDTIKRARTADAAPAEGSERHVVATTLDREGLWAAQTPQVFRLETLRRALGADRGQVKAATDEAMLVEAVGGKVLIHPSPPENFKVTTPFDLRAAELLLAKRSRAA